jgi:hypothetical protein
MRWYSNPIGDPSGAGYADQTISGSPGGGPSATQVQQPIPAAQQVLNFNNLANASPVTVDAPPGIGNYPGKPMPGMPDLSNAPVVTADDTANAPPVDVFAPPQPQFGQGYGPIPGEQWLGGTLQGIDPSTGSPYYNALGYGQFTGGYGDTAASAGMFATASGVPNFAGFGGFGSTSTTGRAGPLLA